MEKQDLEENLVTTIKQIEEPQQKEKKELPLKFSRIGTTMIIVFLISIIVINTIGVFYLYSFLSESNFSYYPFYFYP